jgi:hypothetical protein
MKEENISKTLAPSIARTWSYLSMVMTDIDIGPTMLTYEAISRTRFCNYCRASPLRN